MKNMFSELINDKKYFEELKDKENIVCWGAGSKGRQTLGLLKERDIQPVAFCDNNPQLLGTYIDGIPVLNYADLKKKYENYCICITCVLRNAMEIYHMLQTEGEQNNICFLSNPFKAENKFLSTLEVEKCHKELEESYRLLADEESRQLFLDFLNWKITGDISIIYRNREENWLEVFDENIIPQKNDYYYIDVGAYTGDSICRFLALTQGKYERIIAFEPDENNCAALEALIENGRLERIEVIKKGLWSEEGEKVFYTRAENNVYESSNFFRDTNITLSKGKGIANEEKCQLETVTVKKLDSYIDKFEDEKEYKNILLKIDALGSEGEILLGAQQLIRFKKPVIVMEYGTHSEHIADVLPFLNRLRPDYIFYLRQKHCFDNERTILYAI